MAQQVGILTFQLGGIKFCMDTERILEIVRYSRVCPVPRPLPYVVGLVELRQYIVTVVDFRKRLGLSPLPLSKDTVMVVTQLSTGMTGILVEALSDFRSIPETAILPPISIAGFPEQLLRGVLSDGDDIMLIPDFDQIFASYFHLHLVPISPSEKIAFQYRFTPGSLTRTLEKNLATQQQLDYETVRKLSRSMCLPSVRIHKMTSYYSDFKPHHLTDQRQHRRDGVSRQAAIAGDEQYLSWSHQLASDQQQRAYRDRVKQQQQDVNRQEAAFVIPQSDAPASQLLASLLHGDEAGRSQAQSAPDNRLTTRPGIGRRIAKTLEIAPTRVTKYFTYYCPSPATLMETRKQSEERLVSPRRPKSVEQRLQALLGKSRKQAGKPAVAGLFHTLQTLQQEGYRLTAREIVKLCRFYQIPPMQLARITSYFPEYALSIALQPQTDGEDEPKATVPSSVPGAKPSDIREANQALAVDPQLEDLAPQTPSLGEWLHALAHAAKLHDNRYLRYLAAQVQVATCRLSKLRSYYHWNPKQPNEL